MFEFVGLVVEDTCTRSVICLFVFYTKQMFFCFRCIGLLLYHCSGKDRQMHLNLKSLPLAALSFPFVFALFFYKCPGHVNRFNLHLG
uniref:Uncharacterized protein n=1 Tax=Aegilops tauschii subsp. strangulata TaxID=200361 RepID=A0A453EJF5_AEGTS